MDSKFIILIVILIIIFYLFQLNQRYIKPDILNLNDDKNATNIGFVKPEHRLLKFKVDQILLY
jgi:hypothetical protein